MEWFLTAVMFQAGKWRRRMVAQPLGCRLVEICWSTVMSQCLRRISGLCSLKAAHKVGRVTPCAPQFLWYFANGAHGVTRRTLPGSHTMLVAFLLAGLQVRGAERSEER